MTQAEFVAWREFYKQQPFDDFHRFHRPAALVSVSLGGGDVQARLDWLAPEPEQAFRGLDSGRSCDVQGDGGQAPGAA